MKTIRASHNILAIFAAVWTVLLACRVMDAVVAQRGATATAITTSTRPRPTFTSVAYLLETPTDVPPPPSPTHLPSPTPRPPTRVQPTARPAAALPPPPTPNPCAGSYYCPVFKGCAAASNTRIEGLVMDGGTLRNGVKVRLALSENGPAEVLPDFVTGVDPADPNHVCPECRGKYRLSPSEGSRVDGNWWVYVVDDSGSPISKNVFVHTQDGPGCNTATIDFVH